MPVLNAIDPKEAASPAKEVLATLERALGRLPEMMRLMANSPAILETYVHFNHALERTTLPPKVRALITVAIAEINGCDYTLSLGTALARRQGVSDAELNDARLGRGPDAKTSDALQFAMNIVRRAGRVPHADVERLLRNGFSDEEIVDIIAAVALNIFRNYFNLVVGTEIDSPVVRSGQTRQLV